MSQDDEKVYLNTQAIGTLLQVAASATRLLDALLENRVKAINIRDLCCALGHLFAELPACIKPQQYDAFADEFWLRKFSAVTIDNGTLIFVPVPDDEDELAEEAEP